MTVSRGGADGELHRRRVALLVNFVPPYRVPVLRRLQAHLSALRILISTTMERDRHWQPDWDGLDVRLQASLSRTMKLTHPDGTVIHTELHLPYDTLIQLVRLRPDIVITGEMGLRTLMAWLYRRLVPRSRLVIWATLSDRTETKAGRLRTRLRRLLLWGADAVLTNGQSGRRYLQRLGCPAQRIHPIGQAVPVSLFRQPPFRPPETAHDLVFIGNLEAWKGLLPALDQLRGWAEQRPVAGIRLQIIGRGRQRSDVLEAMARLPANVTAHLADPIPYAAMPALYAKAGVLLLPSLYEEWGLVVNEAMAAGVVVLGSRHAQAVEELIEDGRTGFIFDPEVPGSLAAALDRLMAASPAELDVIRAAAQARIAAVTPDAMADHMAAVLAGISSGRAAMLQGGLP
ncbi:glycosyltransferase family 4 protein [Oleisolibacter albus]|uniref:glycosyltransferase family 4 protein n=1 Tax=Oleisolibacter albus TaxID=2171757 RepID=UPI000DF1BF67|nr:glycosyltransferase family 4 protein [Oleisolibacter albus]